MAHSIRKEQIATLIAVLAIVVALGVTAYFSVLEKSGNVATVQTIGLEIYWDNANTQKVSTIDWGAIGPGEMKNVTVFMVNPGNSSVMLSKSTTNWSSSNASSYFTLDWNYKGQRIDPSQAFETTLTLSASPDLKDVTAFSFDLLITASA